MKLGSAAILNRSFIFEMASIEHLRPPDDPQATNAVLSQIQAYGPQKAP